MSARFGTAVRLRSRQQFQRVQQGGRRIATRYLVLLGCPNQLDHDRLGIIASRKFGNAVARSKAKRRLRELFRHEEPDRTATRGLQPLDVVAIPRRELLSTPLPQVRADFGTALSRLRRSR